MKFRRIFIISLCIVVGVIGLGGGAVYFLGHGLYSRVNYVSDDSIAIAETLPEEAEEETDEQTGERVNEEQLAEIQKSMTNTTSRDVASDEEVYNVLFVGVDRQERDWNGNSDAMILVSLNKAEDRVTMVSLMRDIYADIPNIGYKKLNAAYAYGAGPLLCQTVSDNFKIEVSDYVAVDFWDLVDIVDIIGGIDLYVSPEEAEVANGYIADMCERQLDIDPASHYFPAEGGDIHADGVQTVAYARNRYVGNSDFERTSRQRYILNQILAEVGQMSLAEMTSDMQQILEYITTNIQESELWSMFTELPDVLNYNLESSRIPYDNLYSTIYVDGQDMLVPEWDETITLLHDFIYDYDQYVKETGEMETAEETEDGEETEETGETEEE